MKKVLLSLLVVVLVGVSAISAKAEINWYGQFDVLGFANDGQEEGSGYTAPSGSLMRAILGANFGLAETIDGNITLEYNRFWGEYGWDGPTGNNVLDTVRVAEANVVFKNLFDNDKLSAKVGRFYYGDEDDSMLYFRPKDLIFAKCADEFYDYNAKALDGVVINYNDNEKLRADVGYAKGAEYYEYTDKASSFFAKANYKLNDTLSLKGYVYDYEQINSRLGTDFLSEQLIGVKPEAKLLDNDLILSLEFIQEFYDRKSDGTTAKRFENYAEAYFTKLDAKYSINEDLTAHAMYIYVGKNFNPICDNIYKGLIVSYSYLGYFQDVLNGGIDYKLNKFVFSADYFRFNYEDLDDPYYEIDAVVKYNYSDNVIFRGGIGYNANERNGENLVQYILSASCKFGSAK